MRSFFERADDWLFELIARHFAWVERLIAMPLTAYMLITLSFFGGCIAVALALTKAING